jgi:hypothetical protein
MIKKLIFYILISLVLIPNFSHAQTPDQYTLLEPLPCVAGTNQTCTNGAVPTIDINQYIDYVFKFAVALASLLAVLMIIWGGFQWMVSEVPFIKASGKEKILNAIIGLVMVLASYLILATIDPRLVEIDTTIAPLDYTKGDLKSVSNFQNQLLSDIAKLNTADQTEALKLQKHNTDVQKSIDDIEKLAKEENRPLTDEEKNNIENFKSEIRNNESAIINKTSRFVASKNFSNIIALLDNPDNYRKIGPLDGVRDPALLLDLSTKALEGAQFQLSTYIKDAERLDQIGDHEAAAKLTARGTFYEKQIKEEQALMKDVLSYNYYLVSGSASDKKTATEALNKRLGEYSKTETSDPKLKKDNELFQEYDTIKNNRISLIKKTLAQPKK